MTETCGTTRQAGYKLISAEYPWNLAKNVRELQAEGWITTGGVTTLAEGIYPRWFCQAMIKEFRKPQGAGKMTETPKKHYLHDNDSIFLKEYIENDIVVLERPKHLTKDEWEVMAREMLVILNGRLK
jgi:hypothetical protein